MAACCEAHGRILSVCKGGRKTGRRVIRAWYACVDDIDEIPDREEGKHVISESITFEAEKGWHRIDLESVGSTYGTTTEGEGQSKEYIHTAVLNVAGVHESVSYILNGFPHGEMVYLIQDNNGNVLLYGSADAGCESTVEVTSDPNRYTIGVNWAHPELPLFYEGDITEVDEDGEGGGGEGGGGGGGG